MKKKTTGKAEPIVADEILESARRDAGVPSAKKRPKCEVCAAESAPNSTEPLCWVCRRLKISAWRDSDLQAAAPE